MERKEKSLRKSIVSYIGASSEFTGQGGFVFGLMSLKILMLLYIEPEITLVLSPVTITPRSGERPTHFAGMHITQPITMCFTYLTIIPDSHSTIGRRRSGCFR